MTGPLATLGAGLPELPVGFVEAPSFEPIGERWVWAYAGATCWLPTRYAGEAQPTNNIYAKPADASATEAPAP